MADVLLFPFRVIWGFLSAILNLTGRLVAVLLGLCFLILGLALTVTVIGAILGIPFLIFGVALMLRGLF